MKRAFFCVLFALTLVLSAQEKKPNILLISLDTFRADKLQAYGAKNNIAPNLNNFAKEAQVYTHSMTPAPLTLPAHATLLTGCYPGRTALFDNGVGVLSPSVKTLPEVLRDNGYATRAFISASVLKSRYGLSRGFDIYDDEVGPNQRRIGGDVTERAFAFLTEKKTKPFFLWVHYFDTHVPYFALTGDTPVMEDYDKAVTYVDGLVKRLFDALPPNTITIVVSDHGEALGDHGELTHGILMYQPTTSVVIMVKGDNLAPSIVKDFRTLADIAPTIYKITGIDIKNLDGKPLDVNDRRILPLSNLLPLNQYRWKPLFGAADGRYKWIKGDKLKLFDLQKDPNETTDISNIAPKESLALKKSIPAFESAYRTMTLSSFSGLGYLSGVPQSDVEIDKLKDPEKMLKVFEKIDKVRVLRDNQDWETSAALIKETLPLDPLNPTLLFGMGDSLRHLNKNEEGLTYLEEALKISPALAPAWVSKGYIYVAMEKRDEAAKCFQKALGYDEDLIDALNCLAAYYLDLNKPESAFPLIESAMKRGIANADTHLMQGRIHLIKDQVVEAKKDFGTALNISDDPKVTLKAVGDIYLIRGYKEAGMKILQEGIKTYPDFPANYLTLGTIYLSDENYSAALIVFTRALKCPLSPADKENVTQIVEELRKGLGMEDAKPEEPKK
jgi:arylsulfatase A-like enzyme